MPIFEGQSIPKIGMVLNECYSKEGAENWWAKVVANQREALRDTAMLYLTAHKLRLEMGDNIALSTANKSMTENEQLSHTDLIDLTLPYYEQTIYGRGYLEIREDIRSLIGVAMFLVD